MVLALMLSAFSSLQLQEKAELKEEESVIQSEEVEMPSQTASAEQAAEASDEKTQQAQKQTTQRTTETSRENQLPSGHEDLDLDEDKGIRSNKGKQIEKKEEEKKPETITVVVSINCKNALDWGADVPEYFVQNEGYTAEQGATAFDALKAICDANGLSLKYQRKTYIQGIGGLNEKDCGGASGWMFLVDGVKPPTPASSYVLKNGEVVEWVYVTNSNQ